MAGVRLTWLGQAGFLIEATGQRLLIDPFFSDYEARRYAARTEGVSEQIDWLLATHEHLDHFDTEYLSTLASASAQVRVCVPAPMQAMAERVVPPERIRLVQPGDKIDLAGGLSLEVTPAVHGVTVEDGYSTGGDSGAARFVGYILRGGGPSLYHSGDTLVTDGLLNALAGRQIEVALLPINGRSYFRETAGLVGNMDVRDAVGLAERIGCRTLVPMHWDMFVGNTERPGAVLDVVDDLARQFHVVYPARFVPFTLA